MADVSKSATGGRKEGFDGTASIVTVISVR